MKREGPRLDLDRLRDESASFQQLRLVGIEEALCYGWIDGWFKPLDEERWVIRYTPRRKGSNWSKYNIARAWKLLSEGRMTQVGTARLPCDVLDVWKKHKPGVTVINRVGAQGIEIRFSNGKNYLSKIKMPALAP